MPAKAVLTSNTLRRLRDYWLAARRDRMMPARRDIDPINISPALLPHVVLADVFHDPLRFRYRLIGTRVTAMAGRDATGHEINRDLYGDNTERVIWGYRTCVETRAPVAVREPIQFVAKDWIVIEVLLMPLGDRDDSVDVVLVGVDAVQEKAAANEDRLVLDWQVG